MREIINIHVGQCGVQMGNAVWELLCLEHGLCENGQPFTDQEENDCIQTFFMGSSSNNFTPRSLFVDLEPSVIDEVRHGAFRKLFHPDRLITGPEDAASNFARGFFTVGKLILNKVASETRKLIEAADYVHGIMILRGLGGGTGSGLTSAIFDSLAEYPKTTKLELPIYPSATLSTSTVEPYNCLLAQHFCMEDVDIGLMLENEAAYDICMRNLRQLSPTYNLINRVIAQICSNLTVSLRFESSLCFDLSVLQNSLVPYPRIHFPCIGYAPIVSTATMHQEEYSITDITRATFENESQLIKVDLSFGKYMTCALNFRGPISPYHVYTALNEIKRDSRIEFADWCPTGFKVGINIYSPMSLPDSVIAPVKRSATLLTNTSAIGQVWQRLTHKFYLLYSKRCFVHWYVGEGMEECEFTESLYNMSSLVKDYEQVVGDYNEKEEHSHYDMKSSQVDNLKDEENATKPEDSEVDNKESIYSRKSRSPKPIDSSYSKQGQSRRAKAEAGYRANSRSPQSGESVNTRGQSINPFTDYTYSKSKPGNKSLTESAVKASVNFASEEEPSKNEVDDSVYKRDSSKKVSADSGYEKESSKRSSGNSKNEDSEYKRDSSKNVQSDSGYERESSKRTTSESAYQEENKMETNGQDCVQMIVSDEDNEDNNDENQKEQCGEGFIKCETSNDDESKDQNSPSIVELEKSGTQDSFDASRDISHRMKEIEHSAGEVSHPVREDDVSRPDEPISDFSLSFRNNLMNDDNIGKQEEKNKPEISEGESDFDNLEILLKQEDEEETDRLREPSFARSLYKDERHDDENVEEYAEEEIEDDIEEEVEEEESSDDS